MAENWANWTCRLRNDAFFLTWLDWAVLTWMPKSHCFCITTQRDWFKELPPSFHPIRNQLGLAHTSFPALRVGYMYFLRVFIGSLYCLCSLWLARVILWFWFHDTQLKTALSAQFTDRWEVAETLKDSWSFRNPIQTLFSTVSSEMWLPTK